jgi:hypothetical protein
MVDAGQVPAALDDAIAALKRHQDTVEVEFLSRQAAG